MKIVLILSICVILRAKAWSSVRAPFNLLERPKAVQFISDCMHVTSDEGDYAFKKVIEPSLAKRSHNLVEVVDPDMTVCGLYVVTDPDKYVEISIKYMDVDCDTGGLMAFVDGWELNGEYFPGIHDHQLGLDKRVTEFCSEAGHWPYKLLRKKFVSNQNAALLQYRIPIKGAFVVNVRFIHNPKPCNILTEGLAPFYSLSNYGAAMNCTVTALYPAVVAVRAINVGPNDALLNYDCANNNNNTDTLQIGGSNGLDTSNMQVTSYVCGNSEQAGPEQAIFCGVTSVRLSSNGHLNNNVIVTIRKADENDLTAATLMCDI